MCIVVLYIYYYLTATITKILTTREGHAQLYPTKNMKPYTHDTLVCIRPIYELLEKTFIGIQALHICYVCTSNIQHSKILSCNGELLLLSIIIMKPIMWLQLREDIISCYSHYLQS